MGPNRGHQYDREKREVCFYPEGNSILVVLMNL